MTTTVDTGMDTLCELTSAIVERQWSIDHPHTPHSYIADNGDMMYIGEVQDEFNEVLGILERILNTNEEL